MVAGVGGNHSASGPGAGVPWFAGVQNGPVRFEDPEVIEAPGVTHLRYRVRR